MPVMSRDDMMKVLRDGGSVLHGGRIIAHEHDLPTEADLARHSGNADQVAAAKEALLARKKALDAELAALDAGPAPEVKPVAEVKPAPTVPNPTAPQPVPVVRPVEPIKAPEKK